ncbi:helix-turn-helix domain-containing protein, partial [Microbulbifer sp. 2205BS26-8]|uniref:helix-turn-helix domain-containing protein n=1 Tax=Microbulbifer sp. 2205BS26-8 TaxID=3064386 RepID=UPI003531692D
MRSASKIRGLTTQQKRELWDRWKRGQSLSEIGRALGKHAGAISGMLAIHGGIAPARRSRSARALSSTEREEISRGLSAGLTFSRIAEVIGRSISTVCREVHRNGGRTAYRAR